MTPQLVALDIDGTLVDWSEQPSAAVITAVRAVQRAGAHVVLCTGRSVYAVTGVIDALGLRSGRGVASNGAVTFGFPPVRATSTVTFDARPAVEAILRRVPDALVAVEVVGRGYRVNSRFPEGEITGEMWVEPLDQLLDEPVSRVIIRDPAASADDFLELAAAAGLHGINYSVGFTAWLDLAPEGVSKASALAQVAASLGVPQGAVLAIGDGRNDVEMLAWAGRGVAMGQAPPEVQEVADAVTGSLVQDGVATELARWFPLAQPAEPAAAPAVEETA
ncbi:MAG TPA: HAD family hydrolase [Nocardioidaceae bacterium]|nr:HAD family hydrolase [Nocardioidaceae bacterium]